MRSGDAPPIKYITPEEKARIEKSRVEAQQAADAAFHRALNMPISHPVSSQPLDEAEKALRKKAEAEAKRLAAERKHRKDMREEKRKKAERLKAGQRSGQGSPLVASGGNQPVVASQIEEAGQAGRVPTHLKSLAGVQRAVDPFAHDLEETPSLRPFEDRRNGR